MPQTYRLSQEDTGAERRNPAIDDTPAQTVIGFVIFLLGIGVLLLSRHDLVQKLFAFF